MKLAMTNVRTAFPVFLHVHVFVWDKGPTDSFSFGFGVCTSDNLKTTTHSCALGNC